MRAGESCRRRKNGENSEVWMDSAAFAMEDVGVEGKVEGEAVHCGGGRGQGKWLVVSG